MDGDNVVLTGFMGVGKGTVARELGLVMGRPVVDTDDIVARLTGKTPQQLIEDRGESAFRRWERRAVAMAAGARRTVIATGGGAVLDPVNRRRLERSGVLFHLTATIDAILERTGAGSAGAASRPLLGARDRESARRLVEEMLARRDPSYSLARFTVDTTGRTAAWVAARILHLLGDGAEPAARGTAPAPALSPADPGYPVLCGEGILDQPGVMARALGVANSERRGMLVTDPLVGGMYGGRVMTVARSLGLELTPFSVLPGDRAKSLRVVEAMCRALLSARIGRDGVILALGGGAVGDVAGFVAATYMRGIRYVQLPTTLVAQVDSALGGKTAVNLPGHKNAVGAFHRPAGIIADLSVLGTLPPIEIRSGLAEVLKVGAIADRELWDMALEWAGRVGNGGSPAEPRISELTREVIARCLGHKARIVGDDERELGRREILNFGHTLGHALEAAGRGRLRHGQAVALGMDFAAYLGEGLGFTDPGTHRRMRSALASVKLWTGPPGGDRPEHLLSLVLADKKARTGTPRFVFLRALGSTLPEAEPVDTDRVRTAIGRWLRGDAAG